MKQYIKTNIIPLCIGIAVGVLTADFVRTIDDIIVKIYLIKNESKK